MGWNQSRAAEQFLVADNTIGNWERDQSPESRTVGSLAKPVPPVTRLNDVMARFGFGGAELIATHLALAGFRIAEKTVRNIKRERFETPALTEPLEPPRRPNPVRANFVNHVWMMDVTEFKTLFGASTLHFAAVFDAFSRLPLVGMTFASKPGGTSMARLFKIAVAAFGWPKYVITDLGGEFIAGVFQKTVARLGVNPRFASADNIHATARLERFWKTLKQITGVRLVPPLNLADLEVRLSRALAYYALHRPHTSLGNRTPMQTFLGTSAQALRRLPRGKRGEPCRPSPLGITLLSSGGFPVLTPLAA